MTWTYSSTALSTSDRAWVRFRLGDTSSGDQLLQDEEIDSLISGAGNKYYAAALGAESIAAKLARRNDKTVGRLSIKRGDAARHYSDLAVALRNEAGLSAVPYAGGISISDKQDTESDTDRVVPSFSVDDFEHPGNWNSVNGSTGL